MKFRILLLVFLIQGCVTTTQPRVSNYEIEESISLKTKKYGLSLVSDLEANNYNDVIRNLENKLSSLKKDISKENDFIFEFNHLENYSKDLSKEIDRLVKEHPEDPIAYLIRGSYYRKKAGEARGDKWIHLTSEEQLKNMLALQELAISDLEKSLDLSSENYYAYIELGKIYNTRSKDAENSALYFKRAFEIQPASYWVWAEILTATTPRWGGSYQKMEEEIEKLKLYIPKNPNLGVLRNSILLDKGNIAELNNQYSLAISFYEKALMYGDDHRILIGLSYIYMQQNQYEKGCPLISKAIAQRPYLRRYNVNYLICTKMGYQL